MSNTINDIDTLNGPSPSVFNRIKQSDVSIQAFPAYKQWTFYSGSSTSSAMPLQAIYESTLPDLNSSVYTGPTNIDGSYQFNIYNSINHLFYKYKNQPYNCFGQNDISRTKKFLYQSASVFSLPQTKVGEGVKLESFSINGSVATVGSGVYGSGIYGSVAYGSVGINPIAIASDRYGNLYDTYYLTGSIVSGVKLYEGFNEYFDISRIKYTSEGVTYVPGINTTTGLIEKVGLAAHFGGAGYIETDLDGYYDRDHDYAISFFVSASNGTADNQLILGKLNSPESSSQWPFKLELNSSNEIVASVRGSEALTTQISSSSTSTDWKHVLCQKTGSSLELYIDNTLESTATSTLLTNNNNINSPFTSSARFDNTDVLKMGGYSSNNGNLTGDLDEVRIFNKALTSAERSALSDRTEGGTFLQTNHVGNIFEKQGIAVVSSLDYRYHNLLNENFTGSYRSTMTIHELSTLVRVNMGDLNVSQHDTLLLDDDQTFKSFATGSDFKPYITTIGLYNDMGQLLAIGKLGQPVTKRNDVDLNFLVRIDLDKNIPLKL